MSHLHSPGDVTGSGRQRISAIFPGKESEGRWNYLRNLEQHLNFYRNVKRPLLLLLPSICPSTKVFSSEVSLPIRWPKYQSFSISPSREYSGLISFRIDWFDLLDVQDPSCCKENQRSLLHAATKTWHSHIKIIFFKTHIFSNNI